MLNLSYAIMPSDRLAEVARGVASMGISDPEIQKKIFGVKYQHEIDKQSWPLWKKLIHRLQRCPICRLKAQDRKGP